MSKKITKKQLLFITAITTGVLGISGAACITYYKNSSVSTTTVSKESSSGIPQQPDKPPVEPTEAYQGAPTLVANTFSIKVPNGWNASISNNPNFLAIMFARPNQLESLVYKASSTPVIDYNGIPSWNGLTEHFFVIMPTAASSFNPDDHLEVSSQAFTFDDGTVGQRYYVVKHADEAQKWGGLQKDTEWQGRTYIYEKNGKKVEAHLALYPSTNIQISFYEDVVRTLTF